MTPEERTLAISAANSIVEVQSTGYSNTVPLDADQQAAIAEHIHHCEAHHRHGRPKVSKLSRREQLTKAQKAWRAKKKKGMTAKAAKKAAARKKRGKE